MAWNDKLEKIKEYTDPEGLKYLQMWQNQNYPVDKALQIGDLKAVAKIGRETIPVAKSLIPHVKDEKLQKYLTNAVNRVEKFIGTLEAGGSNMRSLHNYFVSESKNMGGVLVALINTVVDLVDDVGGLVGDVLNSLL